ncbi:hypothetical protein AB0K09_11430 [Streptomyces sp. NPDC049577]|uniref:hypothetical protein n=1 Tax=Streptomyces sp. NPDC049577 TaxID=3155153 RepID=UPI00342CAC71
MYLVHASLRGPRRAEFPVHAGALVLSQADPLDRIEHVVTHAHAVPHPVLGLYVLAERLEDAEARAAGVCRRAVERCPELSGWELVSAQVPLLTLYEDLPSSGLD